MMHARGSNARNQGEKNRIMKGRETVQGLFVLVLLIGSLQFIIIYHWYTDIHRPNTGNLIESIDGNAVQKIVANKPYSVRVDHVELYRRRTYQLRSKGPAKDPDILANLNSMDSFTIAYNQSVSPLLYDHEKYFRYPYQPLLYGNERKNTGYLTVGIPSVRRANTDKIYLYETLDSIIQNTDDENKRQVTVVVFLSDTNTTYNVQLSRLLHKKYRTYCDSGFIRVIHAPQEIYPDLDKVRRTYNDDPKRIKWRTKQNIDYAYLFLYSRNISEFYIQLEDDVITARNFVKHTQIFIESQKRRWFLLEFCTLGFIGKLFHSLDLPWVANVLLRYFDVMPGDMLLGKMRVIKEQKKSLQSDKGLFQHIGKFSSLKDKMMPSIDAHFKDQEEMVNRTFDVLPKRINPPAKISTNLVAHGDHPSYAAYDEDPATFFWAKSQRRGDYFEINFEKPFNFSRIVIATGDIKRKKDSLKFGSLLIAGHLRRETQDCGKYTNFVDFIDGEVDTQAMGITIPHDIVCLKIHVKISSRSWMIIRDIVLI